MSRYPTIASAFLANDNDLVSVGTRKFRISVLDGGPNDYGQVSLIPQASVIQAAHYGDMGREEATPLDYGAAIHVQGFGCFSIVRTDNPDWPKLVPMEGDRYYARYTGGPGYKAWTIFDRKNDGKPLSVRDRLDACQTLFGTAGSLHSRAQAKTIAAYLSAQAEG